MNFYVADWYVDKAANRIRNSEQDIKLESKVMSLLVYLAEHQGDVVSRQQLEDGVWTDRVISYDALTSCITRLRKVLGDNSRQPLYIETVPKKGYRLIAPVRPAGPAQADRKQLSSPQQHKKKSGRFMLITVAMTLLIITALSLINSTQQTDRQAPDSSSELSALPSIMVLPFDNLSAQPAQAYFSEGITADINIALAKLSGLLVVAAPSMLAEHSEQAAGKQPGLAHYLLTGSVQRAGNQLRVNVMLIDNRNSQQLWAESYNREITEVFEVQDDITASIVSTLSIKLTEEEKKRVAHRYTSSIEAYDQFLRGQALYSQRSSTENLLAREHLQRAIDLDARFARAYSTLALTYIDEYRYRWFDSNRMSLLKTLELAEKAVSIDDRLPQAYWALAYAQLHLHRYEQALASAQQALAVQPNYADGYAISALIHVYSGDSRQAISMIRRAMSLETDYPAQYLSVLGQAYYYLGDYENALSAFHAAIDKNFSLLSAQIMLTATLSQAGLAEEASWAATQLHALAPGFLLSDIARIFPLKDDRQRQDISTQLATAGIS